MREDEVFDDNAREFEDELIEFDDDKSSFEDDEFILADWDEVDGSVAAASSLANDETEELFDADPLPVGEQLGESRSFTEDDVEWEGANIELSDLGVEMTEREVVPAHLSDDEAFDVMADDELTLIHDEEDLEVVEREVQGESFLGEPEEPAVFPAAAAREMAAEIADELPAEPQVQGAAYPEDYNQRDFSADASAEPEWAPVSEHSEEDEQLEARLEDGEYAMPTVAESGEPDYSEYEEAYCDETDSGLVPVAAAPRGSAMRWVVGIAAALMLSATGALWYFNGMSPNGAEDAEVIEVIKVDRPVPRVSLQAPTLESMIDRPGTTDPVRKDPATKDPATKDPITTDPITTDPATKDPITTDPVTTDPGTKDPVTTDPGTQDPVATDPIAVTKDPVTSDPGTTDPGTTDPVTTDPGTTDPGTTDPGTTDPVAVGDPVGDPMTADPQRDPDEVQIGEDGMSISNRDRSLMDRHRRTVVHELDGLVMGTQALAQLHNENIFIGKVKALNTAYVTLKTAQGEISLQRTDIRTLTSLAEAEYEEWRDIVSSGFIKLRNNNRLRGKIVEARDDAVVLMVNSNRVIIPKSAIDSVISERRQGVQLNNGEAIEDDDWFRKLVEEKIREKDETSARQRRRSPSSSSPGPAPSPTPMPAPTAPAPVPK